MDPSLCRRFYLAVEEAVTPTARHYCGDCDDPHVDLLFGELRVIIYSRQPLFVLYCNGFGMGQRYSAQNYEKKAQRLVRIVREYQ